MKADISKAFVFVLAIVSIIGFASIVSETLFDSDMRGYADAFIIIILGSGLVSEIQLKTLASVKKGLTQSNFSTIITFVIGIIAILTGILSLPVIGVSFAGFAAIRGILSVLAIVIIIIQTWVVKN